MLAATQNFIASCYLEPHRYYHTLEHIYNALNAFHKINGDGSLNGIEDLVEEAIWWHDAVYVVGAADNEVKSALLAKEYGASYEVQGLVLATIYPAKPREYTIQEAAIMDADLSGLAALPAVFDHHTEQVRAEYLTVFSEEQWNAGRKKFLKNMQAQTALFYTGYGRKYWETAARGNIMRELRELGQ